MITIYNPGPFATFTEVSFPHGELTVRIVSNDDHVRTITFGEHNDVGLIVGPIAAPTFWQRTITGDDSGASVDFSAIPIRVFWTYGTPDPPDCDDTPSDLFLVPSGAAPIESDLPALMGVVFGFVGTDDNVTYAHLTSQRTTVPSGSVCVVDQNAVALPGFIDGETVTLS